MSNEILVIKSKYDGHLPLGLAMLKDEQSGSDVLSLRDDLEIVTARILELTERMKTGESSSAWQQLIKVNKELDEAMKAKDNNKLNKCLISLRSIINNQVDSDEVWKEIHTMMNLRIRLLEAERRRIESLQDRIDTKEALSMMGAVLQVIQENVTDRGTLQAIRDKLIHIMNSSLNVQS